MFSKTLQLGVVSTRSFQTSSARPAINHEFHKIIKWIRPDYQFPWAQQRTCDLRPLDKVDPKWLKLEYRPFAELIEKLPEDHRRIFTVQYGHRKDGIGVIMEDTVSKVRRHDYDTESLDFKIAWATVRIRDFQNEVVAHPVIKKSGIRRNNIKELIEKRKKWLSKMRMSDYKRFEWILEVLGILYKPNAPHTRIERKASIHVLVNMFCNEIREKKINEYKQMLEAEKIPFLETKLATLENIKADEESINMPCSVLEDILETKEILIKLKESHVTVYPEESRSIVSGKSSSKS